MSPSPYSAAAKLARQLRPMSDPQRAIFMQGCILFHGGTLVPAMPGGNWGPHYAEISVLGISHTGDTTEAAIANWIKAAMRTEEFEGAVA